MDKEKLQEILDKHSKWLHGEPDGERADLRGANLYGADLRGADLGCAYLGCANLRGAYLYGANLRDAYLRGADLRGADLRGADLGCAGLGCANLGDADLRGANLGDADLGCANLGGAYLYGAKNIEKAFNLFYPIGCPSDGSFVGWKKARYGKEECIVKLRITEDARRSSATGKKCRCDKAEVLDVQTIEGERLDGVARSDRDEAFLYKTGEIVSVSDFCENRWKECAAGIHFYITREEAVRHEL